MGETIAFEGLTFFTETGALRGLRSPSAEGPAGRLQKLGARLIAPPAQVPKATRLLRRSWSAENRIAGARLLLGEVLDLDRAGKADRAQSTWSWVTGEWTWIARDPKAAAALEEILGTTGEEVLALQAAIESELLPMLHLQALVNARGVKTAVAPCHLEFAAGYVPPADTPPGLAAAVFLAAAALDDLQQPVSWAWIEPVARAIQGGRVPSRAERALLAHVCRGLVRTAGSSEAAPSPEQKTLVDRIAETARPCLAVIETLSYLHTLTGVRSPIADADIHLGVALQIDPVNDFARQQRKALHEKIDGLPDDIRRKVQPKLLESCQQLAWLAQSRRGQELQARFVAALELELVERLGLDPFDPRHRWITGGLVSRVENARRNGVPLERMALARELPEITWSMVDLVEQAVPKLGQASAELLGVLLPVSALPMCATFAPELGTRDGSITFLSRQRAMAWAWCAAPRDKAFKLAAVAGVLLALHGGGRIALDRLARWRQDRAYTSALAAAYTSDDRALVDAGSRFLTLSCQGADPRCPQVRALVSEAVVREVARAVEEGRSEDGRRLVLAHAEKLESAEVAP